MSLIGTITDEGLDKVRFATLNEGFKINVESFSVSRDATAGGIPALAALTSANAGVWFSGPVASRVLILQNTIQFDLEIPPNAAVIQEPVSEIYLYGKDVNNTVFLLAVAQPSDVSLYSPSGQTTLRAQIKLENADLTSLFTFQFTQATEISTHNTDPNAHADIRDSLAKAGIFIDLGQFVFIGQNFDEFANTGGLTGRTIDGTILDKDIVFLDVDNVYKRAIADGSISSHVAGIVNLTTGAVYNSGYVDINHGFPHGTDLYLSRINPGTLTSIPTEVYVGQAIDNNIIDIRIDDVSVKEEAEFVVSDEVSLNSFTTIAAAIAAASDGDTIRVEKLEEIEQVTPIVIDKRLNIKFEGPKTGVTTFAGQNEIQKLTFSSIPDEGEFVLVHDGNPSSRIPFNASTGDIETALDALSSISDVSVTGDFTSGFDVEFVGVDGIQPQLQIFFGTFPGQNEIQKLSFDNTDFDAGTIELGFNGQFTSTISSVQLSNVLSRAQTIEDELNALSTINSVVVTENPTPPVGTVEFFVEFVGLDGVQNIIPVIGFQNNLLQDSGATPIILTTSEDTQGILPDNTLKTATVQVNGAGTQTQLGKVPGTTTAFRIGTGVNGAKLVGNGIITGGFSVGIDLNEEFNTRIEMNFDGIATPIDDTNLLIDDYNTHGSLGLFGSGTPSISIVDDRRVQLFPQAVPNSTLTLSPSLQLLPDGSNRRLPIDQAISNYPGGVIDFQTGIITDGSGSSNFTPAIIPSGNFLKYNVVLQVNDTIKVIPASLSAATASTAPDPGYFGGLLRGTVTVQNIGGVIQPIAAANISRSFDEGAFPQQIQVVYVNATGGNPVVDFSSQLNSPWDPSYDVRDIEVHLNGNTLCKQDLTPTGDFEERTVDFTGEDATAIDGNYWTIYTHDRGYYVWYDVDFGSTDPAPGGGLLPIKVDISSGDTDNDVALATEAVLNAHLDFSASKTSLIVTVTNTSLGNVTDSTIGSTGLSILTTTQGSIVIDPTKDYAKLSETKLVFGYVPGDSSTEICVKFQSSTIDSLTTGASFTASKCFSRNGDGVSTVLDFSGTGIGSFLGDDLSFNADNNVFDIEVRLNGQVLKQETTASGPFTDPDASYRKIAPNSLEFSGPVLPTSTNIVVKTQEVVFGSGNVVGGVTKIESEGAPVGAGAPAGILNFTGSGVSANQPGPSGEYDVVIPGSEATNIGTGVGAFENKVGNVLEFCSFRGEDGIIVTKIGNDVVIGIGQSPYFVYYTSLESQLILALPDIYDLGSKKLTSYRNGVRMFNSPVIGTPVHRYDENTFNTVRLEIAPNPLSDWFGFVNNDTLPIFSIPLQGTTIVGETLIPLPASVASSNQLLVFRNGLLMTESALGDPAQRYTLSSPTEITLEVAVGSSDNLLIELVPNISDREDVGNIVGNTITISNAYTPGDERTLFYRNGVLMANSTDVNIGDPVNRYQEGSTTTFTLELDANLSDRFTKITL